MMTHDCRRGDPPAIATPSPPACWPTDRTMSPSSAKGEFAECALMCMVELLPGDCTVAAPFPKMLTARFIISPTSPCGPRVWTPGRSRMQPPSGHAFTAACTSPPGDSSRQKRPERGSSTLPVAGSSAGHQLSAWAARKPRHVAAKRAAALTEGEGGPKRNAEVKRGGTCSLYFSKVCKLHQREGEKAASQEGSHAGPVERHPPTPTKKMSRRDALAVRCAVHDVEKDARGQLGPKVVAALPAVLPFYVPRDQPGAGTARPQRGQLGLQRLRRRQGRLALLQGRVLPREGLVRGPQLRGGRLRPARR